MAMKKYYFLLYLRGEKSDSFTPGELEKIQSGHVAHIERMLDEGVACMAGPFDDDTEKRGLIIFDLDQEDEVRGWADQDPGVQSGRLSYEIHPWWGLQGSVLK